MTTERSSRDIIKDYKPHIDGHGMIQPRPNEGSLNGVRNTAEYIIALNGEGKLDEERQRLLKVYQSVQKEPGLLMRTPDNAGGYQSIDDTVSAITADYFLGGNFAEKFLWYGKTKPALSVDQTDSNKEKVKSSRSIFKLLSLFGPVTWVYNNVNPQTFSTSSWMGRFPQLIAHAQFAANKPVSLWRQIWWAGTVLQGSFSKQQDSKALAWQLVLVAQDKSILCDLVGRFYSWMLRHHYPEGIGQVLGDYYGNHDHPSAYWLLFEYGE